MLRIHSDEASLSLKRKIQYTPLVQNSDVVIYGKKEENIQVFVSLPECSVVTISDSQTTCRKVWANSVDPDQTAPKGSTLFAIPSALFGPITL